MADEQKAPTPENYTILQFFEWYCPPDQKHFKRLVAALPGLKDTGFSNVWLPPQCKASNPKGNGYDIYDLWDLGEFDQKGGVSTKWGTREDLQEAVDKAAEVGIGLYFDAVLNHKAAADHVEKCTAVKVDEEDRTKEISEPMEIEAWLGFDFDGRGDKYSSQKYHWHHFSGTDFNAKDNSTGIFKILGDGNKQGWSDSVDTGKGNYDFLMFADLDYNHKEVRDDVKNWAVWVVEELKLSGFRFDAVRHFSEDFMVELIGHLEEKVKTGLFFVGEVC